DAMRDGARGRPERTAASGQREGRRPSLTGALRRRLLRGGLELAARGDLHAVARGDLDGRAGRGVTARASGAEGALERDPARDGDLRAPPDGRLDDVEERVDDRVDVALALTGGGGDRGDQVALVEGVSHGCPP